MLFQGVLSFRILSYSVKTAAVASFHGGCRLQVHLLLTDLKFRLGLFLVEVSHTVEAIHVPMASSASMASPASVCEVHRIGRTMPRAASVDPATPSTSAHLVLICQKDTTMVYLVLLSYPSAVLLRKNTWILMASSVRRTTNPPFPCCLLKPSLWRSDNRITTLDDTNGCGSIILSPRLLCNHYSRFMHILLTPCVCHLSVIASVCVDGARILRM